MENNMINNKPFLKDYKKQFLSGAKHNNSDYSENSFWDMFMPKAQLYKLVARLVISLISIVLITIFVRNNNMNLQFSTVPISENVLELFHSLGFPPDSKDYIYSRLDKWGFDLNDIGDEEINENYEKEDNLKKYKYSNKTYKELLFSLYENKKNSLLEKNALFYAFLSYLKTKEINTFYEFLNNFVILQDLNCLPVNYKGIYINNKLFVPNHTTIVKLVDSTLKKTLVDEAPFIYLTSHGGKKKNSIHNICKFSRDGYFLGSVLLPFEEDGIFFNSISLRGLLLDGDNIYVVDSYKNNSKIFQFSDSIPKLGNRREFVSTFISQNEKTNPLMIHPYGIKKHKKYFYVSAQNTSSLLRYNITDGKCGPSESLHNYDTPGLIVKLKQNEEIRGIDFDAYDKCYVANKQTGVQVYDENFNLIKVIPVYYPISIYYNDKNDHILVGSSKTHDIKEYDVHNFELIKSIKHPLLKHVAGISVLDDSIFVVSQKKNKILEFSISTGLLKNTIIDDLSDIGERVVFSQT